MAIINPINHSPLNSSAYSAPSGSERGEMGQDMFFELLIAQLQNQDPLSPLDSTEFTAQLAQFSQLEKLNNMNTTLSYLQLYLASLNNAQAVDFIGKEIEAKGDSVQLLEGGSASINYELIEDTGSVTIKIYDQDMRLVRVLEAGSKNAGRQVETWDGKDKEGNQVGAGTYTFEVSAASVDGEEIAVSTYIKGSVTGVTFEDGITYLMLGEQKIAVGDVIKVLDGEVVVENEPQSGTERALEIMKGIGQFMKNAAPIAAMVL